MPKLSKNLFYFLATAFFSLSTFYLRGQNLVPNGDFELTGNLPCGWCTSTTVFRNATQDWYAPNYATPDIISLGVPSNCSNSPLNMSSINYGYQLPNSGETYAGFYTAVFGLEYHEYIEVKLIQPMIIGSKYIIKFYVSLQDNCRWSTNNIGVKFSVANISVAGNLYGIIPQINRTNVISDTANWFLIQDTIQATNPWEYLVIGNFYPDSLTTINMNNPGQWFHAYYYIDDVSVERLIPNEMDSDVDHELNKFDFKILNQEILFYMEIQKARLFTLTGKCVGLTNSSTMNISGLEQGLYILEVEIDKMRITRKVII